MKYEGAFYYKNLLMLGFSKEYEEWLNCYLESENPLSDIVLELSSCGKDINKAISILNKYCLEKTFDESIVCEKLRLFFKEMFYSNKMTKEEITSSFYRLAFNIGDSDDFDIELWGSMYFLDDYYCLAKDGTISWESFDSAFFDYLDNGIPLDSNVIWSKNIKRES